MRTLTHNGMTMTIAEWSEHLGITHKLIRARLAKNWPMRRVLSKHKYSPRPAPMLLTYNGECMNIVAWAEKLGVHPTTMWLRVQCRKSADELFKPARRGKSS